MLSEPTTGRMLAAVDHGERARDVLFDPWRRRLYVVTDVATSVRSPSGELLSPWHPYQGRTGARVRHLAVSATFLATIAEEHGRTAARIDLWDPWTFGLLETLDVPH